MKGWFPSTAPPEPDWSLKSLENFSNCRCEDYPLCLLNEEGERNLEILVKLMKRNHKKTRGILKQWVHIEGPLPPLQLICRLNEEGILFATTYFYLVPHRVDYFYEAFEAVYSDTAVSSSRRSAAAAEVSCLIAQVVNTLMTRDEKMQLFFKVVSNKIVEAAVKLISEDAMQGCYLTDLLNNNYIFQQCLPDFLLSNLKQLLSYPTSEIEPNIVLRTHTERWSSQKLNVGTAFSIAKMLSFLSPEVIISELKMAADLSPCRWKFILSVMSILVTENNESIPLIKGLLVSWLRTGLEEDNKHSLFLALVAARHCCAEKSEHFPNYITWFGSAQPSNPSHFVAFFKFLSELVPHEPPLYLKIHVNKVPAAPMGCQTVLTDYVSLAKTRLSDLNETTDYLSIFNKCHETEEENHASDVLQLINHFKTTNEIAKPIIEASVFRKQYYEKIFLKYLLKTSARDDPERAQVIHKLNSLGKIPPALFDLWLSKLDGVARDVVGWGSGGGEPAADESEGAKTPVRLLDLDGRAGDVGSDANVDYWDFHWTSWGLFIVATFVAIGVAVAVAIVAAIVVAIVVAIDLVPQRLVPEVSSLPGVSMSCGEDRVECGDGMLIWCGDDHIGCGDDHGDIGIRVSIGCGDDRIRCGDDHIWCGDNHPRCGDGMPSRCADDLIHHGVGVPIWCVDDPICK
ncbi:hypothetical protein GE061_002844 [Apolygus lucorum]|uniref:Fanconi anaemia group A protein N-terminal domain-containing protein n=1 Tax=Apolygus lucorum TaxID=248454 RepID=A0A8S9X680_APOLU|nr:hypothetical protein GE061_002844 [Apolygus lucorum]